MSQEAFASSEVDIGRKEVHPKSPSRVQHYSLEQVEYPSLEVKLTYGPAFEKYR